MVLLVTAKLPLVWDLAVLIDVVLKLIDLLLGPWDLRSILVAKLADGMISPARKVDAGFVSKRESVRSILPTLASFPLLSVIDLCLVCLLKS